MKGSECMKIKDVEILTGMSRDNIRFYEKQGLLEISRNENGYRDYTEDHVQVLKRIKLLRSLNISIEDIKEIQENKVNLSNYLNKHIEVLENEKYNREKMTKLCNQIINDDVNYSNLNIDTYLNYLDNVELKEDVNKTLKAPFKRYFARTIDFSMYYILIEFIMVFLFNMNINIDNLDLFINLLAAIAMIAIEPFFLNKFKTTPGKWIFGLYVTDYNENALSYWDGVSRTLYLVIYGYGCMIPLLSLIAVIISFYLCMKEKTLVWENGNLQTVKDKKKYRYILFIVVFIVQTLLSAGLDNYCLLPKNRGNITVSEFVENMNHLNITYNDNDTYTLLEDGTWEYKYPENYYVIEKEHPTFHFKEENGELIEVSFTLEYEDGLSYILKESLTELTIASFVKAQPSYSPYHVDAGVLLKGTDHNFKQTVHGCTIKSNYIYHDSSNPMLGWTYTLTITKEK